jgi:hypothetical protein
MPGESGETVATELVAPPPGLGPVGLPTLDVNKLPEAAGEGDERDRGKRQRVEEGPLGPPNPTQRADVFMGPRTPDPAQPQTPDPRDDPIMREVWEKRAREAAGPGTPIEVKKSPPEEPAHVQPGTSSSGSAFPPDVGSSSQPAAALEGEQPGLPEPKKVRIAGLVEGRGQVETDVGTEYVPVAEEEEVLCSAEKYPRAFWRRGPHEARGSEGQSAGQTKRV